VRPAGGTPPWGGVGLPPGWAVLGAHGSGGIGLHGIGGFQPGIDFFPSVPPGVGVLAQGGRVFTEFNTTRQPHGAGVVALAGGDGQPVPPLTATGGIGVYGQGADAEEETGVTASGDPAPAGPMDPGAGVMGRGGVTSLPAGPIAAGVIGLAGQTPIPPISETGGSGVYGGGPTGVFGRGAPGVRGKSDGGAGVNGLSDADRGGVFESVKSAQVQLVPSILLHLPPPVTVTVTAIPVPRQELGPALPWDGRAGDLIAITDDHRQCTLWFCVIGANDSGSGVATWSQVLLGSPFIPARPLMPNRRFGSSPRNGANANKTHAK
jgi:hypothetical protein